MLNNNKFTFVNVCFQHKRNDEIGLYGQTLIKNTYSFSNSLKHSQEHHLQGW